MEELTPLEHEVVIFKKHPSAFVYTSLEKQLNNLGVSEVAIAGIHTNLAVFFSAVDAKEKGLKVIINANCVFTDNNVIQAVFINEMKETHKIEIF